MKSPWKQRGKESSPQTTEPAPAPSCLLPRPHRVGAQRTPGPGKAGTWVRRSLRQRPGRSSGWDAPPWVAKSPGHAGPVRALVLSPGRGKGLGRNGASVQKQKETPLEPGNPVPLLDSGHRRVSAFVGPTFHKTRQTQHPHCSPTTPSQFLYK